MMARKLNLFAVLLETFLLMAIVSTAATLTAGQTGGCNCANASLVGDTVATQLNGGGANPLVNSPVNSGIELPNAGPTLGAAGSAPRWNINFASDTIRIDFLQQTATYGAGMKFVFTSLDPQLPGCPPAFISGITVTTNHPTVPFNVITAATFGPHTVTVQIAPNSGNLNWQPGEFVLVKLSFACDTPPTNSFDPCCPPWNQALLKDMMFYQGQGSISAPYTLHFQPTPAFQAQMQAYINYLHLLNPAISSITIDWRLHNQGQNSLPNSGYGPQIGPTAYTTWVNGGNGNPSIAGQSNLFNLPTAFPMQVGTWYLIHTGIYLDNGQRFFPDSCANNEIYVRIQVMNAKLSGAPVLEFSDGKKVIKSVPISENKEQRQR